jgi:hypothetical protein
MSTVERAVGVTGFLGGVAGAIVWGVKASDVNGPYQAYLVLKKQCEVQIHEHWEVVNEWLLCGCRIGKPVLNCSTSLCHNLTAAVNQGYPACSPGSFPGLPHGYYLLATIAALVACVGLGILIYSCFTNPIQSEKSQIQGFCRRKQIEEQPLSESGKT